MSLRSVLKVVEKRTRVGWMKRRRHVLVMDAVVEIVMKVHHMIVLGWKVMVKMSKRLKRRTRRSRYRE